MARKKQGKNNINIKKMSEYLPYNRRKFIGNLSMAVGAVGLGISGLGMSELVDAQCQHARAPNAPFIAGELSSLKHANGWLNTTPLDVAGLKNKVVLINFWTYTCINWLRTLPYIREWSEKYKAKGLVLIGIHTPEFSFEHNIQNVTRAVKDLDIDYPVAIDNDRSIWERFSNNYWPAVYILDASGKIRHHHFGEGGYDDCEKMIQQLLSEAGSVGIDPSLVNPQGKGIEAQADWDTLLSTENYLGHERTQYFSSPGRVMLNKRRRYSLPELLKLNHWALSGEWIFKRENLVLQSAAGRIACQFHARDVHLVMGPSVPAKSIPFTILIDGKPPVNANGTDIDDKGNGLITQQRLYHLVRQRSSIIDRRFEILFPDAGLEAFAFTFG